MSKVLMRSKVRRGTCLVWGLLAEAAVAAAIQALSVGYVILLALKIEGAFEFVLYTDSQYAGGQRPGTRRSCHHRMRWFHWFSTKFGGF